MFNPLLYTEFCITTPLMTGSNSIRPKHEKLTVSNLKFSLSYIKNKVMKISLRRQGTCHECRRTPQGEGDARKSNVSFPKSRDKAKHLGAGAQTKEVAGRPRLSLPLHC